jgi:hypothetical protein
MTSMRSCSVPAMAGVLLAGAALVGCSPDSSDVTAPTTSDSSTTATPTVPDAVDPSTVPDVVDPSTVPDVVDPSTTVSRPTGPFGQSGLAFFGDCPSLLGYLREEAGERVTAWGLGGGGWWGPMFATESTMAAAEDTSGGAAPSGPVAGVDYSTTNVQEEGVDEADVVETDGTYLYASVQDGLRIVDLAEASVVARPELPVGDHQLLLVGDRLVVTTQGWTTGEDTIVSVYDVSDPTGPELVRRTHLEGRLVAARAADGTARLVLSSSLQQRLAFVQPQMFGLDE